MLVWHDAADVDVVPLCRPHHAICYFFQVNQRATTKRPRARADVKAGLTAFAAILALVAGCGKEHPPPAGETAFVPNVSGGTSGGGFSDAGSTKPPGCGQKDDGSYCDCLDTPLFAEAPNIYFVLDRSGSMSEDNKWGLVRQTVAQILRGLGPRANFGATLFPGFDDSISCSNPVEAMPITPGDPPSTVDGPVTKKLLTATQSAPSGGTPTAAALRAVLPLLQQAKGKTFVILATDGGPNCNAGASCTSASCQPNIDGVQGCSVGGPSCCEPPNGYRESCLDSAATVSGVAALKAAGIPVYIIGLPGTASPVYASLLDELAVAGGTALPASPKYYKVASASDNTLLTALKKIAAQIVATCEFKLTETPKQADQVNVYLDEVVLPKDPVNGWKIEGATVTLLGDACSKVLAGDILDVRIITGCPTVQPR
jgi:hypothetical protein